MSDQPVRRVSRFVRNHPWAITREKLDAICEVIDARMRGVMLSQDEIQARVGAVVSRRETSIVNAVAIIPCYGIISQRMNMMTAISGGTSSEQFIAQVRQAVADETIKGIIIDCDSPGGTVNGIIEAADALYAVRGSKPIVAVANPLMGSAAYWLLSQCDEIVGTPSANVGSIGVFVVHEDVSAANEKAGYKPTYIFAGDYKTEDNEDQPLGDDARAFIQGQVNTRYGDFLKAISRGRGLSVSTVKSDFGKGRVFFAKEALAAKMIDRIATLDETITRLMGRKAGSVVRMAAVSKEVEGTAAGKDQQAANPSATSSPAAARPERYMGDQSCPNCEPDCPCEQEDGPCQPGCSSCSKACSCNTARASAVATPTSGAPTPSEAEATAAMEEEHLAIVAALSK